MKIFEHKIQGKESWVVIFGLPIFYCRNEITYLKKRFLCFRWISVNKELLLKSINKNLNYIKNQIEAIEAKSELEDNLEDFPLKINGIAVSVIIPIFNNAEHLSECLDSVIKQSVKNIEIICINDGSTDNTTVILSTYQKKDKRIKIINQKNLGAGIARNNGLKIAQGKYIFFIDGDDILPNKDSLKKLLAAAEKYKVSIAGGSQHKFLPDGTIKTKFEEPDTKLVFTKSGFINYRDYQYDFGYQRFIYRKDLLDRYDIKFPTYRRFQDPPFFVSAMQRAVKFYAIKDCVYLYRSNYKTINWTAQKFLEALEGMNDLLVLSNRENFDKLHLLTLKRIKSMDLDKLDKCTPEVLAAIKKITENINQKVIENSSGKFRFGYITSLLRKACKFESVKNWVLSDRKIFKYIISDYARQYCWKQKIQFNYKDNAEEFKHKEAAQHAIPIKIANIENCKLSIIIPCFNVEDTIQRTIDSIISQKFEDYEVILVEDRSTNDRTFEKCLKIAEQNPKISLYRNPHNSGLGASRNLGLQYAKGSYISFIDSDDWYDTNALAIFDQKTNETPEAEVIAFSFSLYDCTKKKFAIADRAIPNEKTSGIEALEYFITGKYRLWQAGTKIYKKSFLAENNIKNSENILYEDSELIIKAFGLAKTVLLVKDRLMWIDRSTDRSSIMRDNKVRYSNFISTIKNIVIQKTIMQKLALSEDLINLRLSYFAKGHHLHNILSYITYCETKDLSNPLTEDNLDILLDNKPLCRELLTNYSEIWKSN